MLAFRTEAIAQLAHELTLAPVRQRQQHLDGATRAIELIESNRSYPHSFVVFQITGYRSRKTTSDVEISGRDLIADLVSLIETLSLASPAPTPEGHHLLEGSALCQRWKISSKTLARWRSLGLPARWYAQADEPARLLFDEAAVARFE